tara:strand:- start:157 stop:1206 length:1050 start_codon:yes stop_codon:yes gene_type:complete
MNRLKRFVFNNYEFLKNILFKIKYNLVYLIKYFKIKKKSFDLLKNKTFLDKKIDTVIIAQIQRSGGTLLSQLFDGHNQLAVHPAEVKIVDPKHDWSKRKNYILAYHKGRIRDACLTNIYRKSGPIHKNQNLVSGIPFEFDLYTQKFIFNYLKGKNVFQKFNNYMRSFFLSFDSYNQVLNNKKYFVGFIPNLINNKFSVEEFLLNFEDGYLISIIRDPKSWLASATRHSRRFRDPKLALKYWKNNCLNTLNYKKKNEHRLIIIDFDDLVTETERTMKKLCLILNIEYSDKLLVPTFSDSKIQSNSSFKATEGFLDKSTLKRNVEKDILENNKDLIDECLHLKSQINNLKI